MSDAPDMTAAPAEIVLGDKTFRMAPLTDADIAELDNWVRVRALRLARESLAEATPAERREIMTLAFETVPSFAFSAGVGAKMMATIDGVARMIWQGVQHCHPEVTVAEIQERILTPETMTAAMDAWTLINQGGGGKDGEAQAAGKKSDAADAEGQGGPVPDAEPAVRVDAEPDRGDDAEPAVGLPDGS